MRVEDCQKQNVGSNPNILFLFVCCSQFAGRRFGLEVNARMCSTDRFRKELKKERKRARDERQKTLWRRKMNGHVGQNRTNKTQSKLDKHDECLSVPALTEKAYLAF